MKIGLIPLDERPANTRYPRMIGAIAGAKVVLPPAEQLSRFRQPADCAALGDWLMQQATELDALVVSLEMLAFGGLLPSRITDDDLLTALRRLSVLRLIKRAAPELRIYGFGLITRISASADSIEEPAYWHGAGPGIYRYSQDYDRHRFGAGPPPDPAQVSARYLADVMKRRLRNHQVNLAALDLLADDVFELLVISSDDTSEFGFGTREKAWVAEWADRRGGDARLLMYPGADEVGSALLSRALVERRGTRPRFHVNYAIKADAERVAPFEDGPVCLTLERQLRAVGGEQVAAIAEADPIVAVNPPAPSGQPFFDPAFAADDRAYREAALDRFARRIADWIAAGRRVIVCDVAYPNGSDPVLIEALQRRLRLTDLAAYGAWNTAGNTIGVALAQGVAGLLGDNASQNQRFLAHRFVEDYCFMHIVRPKMAAGDGIYDAATAAAMTTLVERELNSELARLADFSGWRVSKARLPWGRRFEVDFDLERV